MEIYIHLVDVCAPQIVHSAWAYILCLLACMYGPLWISMDTWTEEDVEKSSLWIGVCGYWSLFVLLFALLELDQVLHGMTEVAYS